MDSEVLIESCQMALDYISSKQSNDGLWRDYNTLAGFSSEWVSGYVCSSLFISNYFVKETFLALRTIMSRQRGNGGWSYNKNVPTDADSTAWVLMAMGSHEMMRPSMKERGIKYLKFHQIDKSGGFATYSEKLDGIHKYIGANPEDSLAWYSEHNCVTAIVLESLLLNGISMDDSSIKKAVNFLLDKKEKNGLWKSYWWNGYSYCTYHAMKALYYSGALSNFGVSSIQTALIDSQNFDFGWSDKNSEDSEIFSSSLNIKSLLFIPNQESIRAAEKGINYILGKQNEDGSWSPDAYLRIPFPDTAIPDNFFSWKINGLGSGVMVADVNKLFTTVTALSALKLFFDVTYKKTYHAKSNSYN